MSHPSVHAVTDTWEVGLQAFAGIAATAIANAQQRSWDFAVAGLASRIVAERRAVAAANVRAARAHATFEHHRRVLQIRAAAARAARG